MSLFFFALLFSTPFQLFSIGLVNHENTIHFKHIFAERSFSQYDITSVLQDDVGFIWIGTYDGLICMDESSSRIYRNVSNLRALRSSRILCMEKDNTGNIWIGTDGGGVSVYNMKKGSFFYLNSDALDGAIVTTIKCLSDASLLVGVANGDLYHVKILSEDYKANTLMLKQTRLDFVVENRLIPSYPASVVEFKNKILIGFRNSGLYEFDYESGVFNSKLKFLHGGEIESIYIDSNDNIWLGTNGGVRLLNYSHAYSSYIDLTSSMPVEILSDIHVTCVIEDKNQKIWLATRTNGLFSLNKRMDFVDEYQLINFTKQNSGIHSDRISYLYVDDFNRLWCGSYDNGVSLASLSKNELMNIDLNVSGKIYENVFVSSIFSDSYNNIWIGTQDQGLFRIDKANNKIERYSGSDFFSRNQSVITSIMEDEHGNIWFASWNGCFYIEKNDVVKKRFNIRALTDKKLSHYLNTGFYTIVKGTSGDIWLGSRDGLFRIKTNPESGLSETIHFFKINQNAEHDKYPVFSIYPINDTEVFVGTKGNGLKHLHFSENGTSITKFEDFRGTHRNATNRINSDNVWCIAKIGDDMYIGTDEGINLLKYEAGSYKAYDVKEYNEFLAYGKIMSMCTVQDTYLWLGSTFGAVRINTGDSHIQQFKHVQGLISNSAINAIDLRKTENVLYFGSTKGVSSYINGEKQNEIHYFKPRITQIKVNGNEIGISEADEISALDNIPFLKELKLKYNQDNVALTISTFDYIDPSSSVFEYKMEGNDRGWIKSRGGEKTIIYQNLQPGKYKFLLRASVLSENREQKTEETLLLIDVQLPPWLQWWAVCIYVLLTTVVLYVLFRIFKWRLRLYNELRLEKFRHQQDKEMNDLKNNLFVNVSHELRTPLTLILSPVKEISRLNLDEKTKRLFSIIDYNANRLMSLTDQLLDAERNNKLLINVNKHDVIALLRIIITNFTPLANEKRITLVENYHEEKIQGYFDVDLLEKIISNLIFNAIKYTNENGTVKIDCEVADTSFLQIIISDNGKGISSEKLETIFSRYYQIDETLGFGIGLSAVRQMVESHHGSIDVDSTEGKGTQFTIRIPISENMYNVTPVHEHFKDSAVIRANKNKENSKRSESSSVLIVEDNDDLRNYFVEKLSLYYVVYVAEDGESGLKTALQKVPDIIVTDVMMPVMNGIEMVKQLVEHETTRHIPIIFLTAKGSIENQLEGVQSGAVDYMVKPVDLEMLRTKIDNQARVIRLNREKVKLNYMNSLSEDRKDNNEGRISQEEEFIRKAESIIQQYLSDTKFDVQKLASEMATSKTQLHRRFRSVMDVSPGEFIRLTKLKKAYFFLSEGIYNVSEVVFQTGFENHSHFTKLFKKYYGRTPQQLIRGRGSKD